MTQRTHPGHSRSAAPMFCLAPDPARPEAPRSPDASDVRSALHCALALTLVAIGMLVLLAAT